MSLHMLSFHPDLTRLFRLAQRERLLPPGDDPGYALHAVFAACFGHLAPKPFVLLPPGSPGGGAHGRLLAYGPVGLDVLRDQAAAFADPAFSAVLALETAEAKTMPEHFAPGTRLGFRVRLRPVVRTGKSRTDKTTSPRERDLYQAPAEGETPLTTRSRLYRDWLAARLATTAGAHLNEATLETFRLTNLFARNRSPGATGPRPVPGPDATLSGTLTITDTTAFAAGLARGIGRHRAFGFGMLLLSPAGR